MWNHPIPGARETVLGLRAGGYRVAVVSNSDGTVAEELDLAGFGGLFETVIDSTTVGISKPDPGIFDLALGELAVSPDRAWYVGDSHYHDIGGARAAGLAGAVLIDPLGLGPPDQRSVRRIAELSRLLPTRLPPAEADSPKPGFAIATESNPLAMSHTARTISCKAIGTYRTVDNVEFGSPVHRSERLATTNRGDAMRPQSDSHRGTILD